MNKEEKENVTEDLFLIARRISQGANIAIALFRRKVRLLALLIVHFLEAAYNLIIIFLPPAFLILFGIEIIFYTNLGLGWQLIGYSLLAVGASIIYYFFYALSTGIKLNNKKDIKLPKNSENSNIIFWFTVFSIVSLFIIRMANHPFFGFNFYQEYNFKFIVLEKIQTNVDYLLAIFPVLFLFLVLLAFLIMQGREDKNEDKKGDEKAQSTIIKP